VVQVSQMAKSACVDAEHVCKEKTEFATKINGQQSEIRYEEEFRLGRALTAVLMRSVLGQAGNTSLLARHGAACDVRVDHDEKQREWF
jgi:hypothetical protein